MVNEQNFPNAYAEIWIIINNVEKAYFDALPEAFIDKIKSEMNTSYEFKIDDSKPFEKQDLLYETKIILTYLYKNFWGTEEQKNFINKKFLEDVKKINYGVSTQPLDVFKEQSDESINKISVREEQSLFKRILEKIKAIFK